MEVWPVLALYVVNCCLYVEDPLGSLSTPRYSVPNHFGPTQHPSVLLIVVFLEDLQGLGIRSMFHTPSSVVDSSWQ